MVHEAVLMPNWIGDFILALAVVKRKYVKKDDITLIVPEKLSALSDRISPFRSVISDQTARRLKKRFL